jgi:general secretion pathway protein D
VAEFWSGTEAAFRTQPIALRTTPSDAPSIQVPAAPTSAAPTSAAPPSAVAAAPASPAVAAAAKAPTVQFSWIGPSAARVGEPVTLSLNAKSDQPMASASLQIAYDPLKLAVVEVKEGSLLGQGEARTVFNHKVDPARGRILVSINRGGASGASGDAPIVEVTFKAVTEAAAIPVELTVASPVGTGGRPLESAAGVKHELRVEQ